jgi:hypothetical protein
VQLARMPAEVRPLLLSRTVGVAYAPILLTVVVAILAPRAHGKRRCSAQPS